LGLLHPRNGQVVMFWTCAKHSLLITSLISMHIRLSSS
jgi:hypothetical protein